MDVKFGQFEVVVHQLVDLRGAGAGAAQSGDNLPLPPLVRSAAVTVGDAKYRCRGSARVGGFTRAGLVRATLPEVIVSGLVGFGGADFRAADFRAADFRAADFRGADFRGAAF
ncbi:MAG: pentapeptide repeat-containing protein [Mycolicibacterium sp.]|uniref:pentapeptide repeat-containing protein n=1 Tax=Mycolicibacterium sp. TaxID=2320850 RepID=UPI003D1152ED